MDKGYDDGSMVGMGMGAGDLSMQHQQSMNPSHHPQMQQYHSQMGMMYPSQPQQAPQHSQSSTLNHLLSTPSAYSNIYGQMPQNQGMRSMPMYPSQGQGMSSFSPQGAFPPNVPQMGMAPSHSQQPTPTAKSPYGMPMDDWSGQSSHFAPQMGSMMPQSMGPPMGGGGGMGGFPSAPAPPPAAAVPPAPPAKSKSKKKKSAAAASSAMSPSSAGEMAVGAPRASAQQLQQQVLQQMQQGPMGSGGPGSAPGSSNRKGKQQQQPPQASQMDMSSFDFYQRQNLPQASMHSDQGQMSNQYYGRVGPPMHLQSQPGMAPEQSSAQMYGNMGADQSGQRTAGTSYPSMGSSGPGADSMAGYFSPSHASQSGGQYGRPAQPPQQQFQYGGMENTYGRQQQPMQSQIPLDQRFAPQELDDEAQRSGGSHKSPMSMGRPPSSSSHSQFSEGGGPPGEAIDIPSPAPKKARKRSSASQAAAAPPPDSEMSNLSASDGGTSSWGRESAPPAPHHPPATKSSVDKLNVLYDMGDEPERRPFLDHLLKLLEETGVAVTNVPVISKISLDLFKFYKYVQSRGGFVEVQKTKHWKDIAGYLGISAPNPNTAYTLKKQYMKFLLPYEARYERGGVDVNSLIEQADAAVARSPSKGSGGGGSSSGGSHRKRSRAETSTPASMESGDSNSMPFGQERVHMGFPPAFQQSQPGTAYPQDMMAGGNEMYWPQQQQQQQQPQQPPPPPAVQSGMEAYAEPSGDYAMQNEYRMNMKARPQPSGPFLNEMPEMPGAPDMNQERFPGLQQQPPPQAFTPGPERQHAQPGFPGQPIVRSLPIPAKDMRQQPVGELPPATQQLLAAARQRQMASNHTMAAAEIVFPPDSVEATEYLSRSRQKLTAKDVGDIKGLDMWKLHMRMKSGLLAESGWAFEMLNIYSSEEQYSSQFKLANLPAGFLDTIIDWLEVALNRLLRDQPNWSSTSIVYSVNMQSDIDALDRDLSYFETHFIGSNRQVPGGQGANALESAGENPSWEVCVPEVPFMNLVSEADEEMARKSISISTCIRNFSAIHGNENHLSKNQRLLRLLGKLVLFNHRHIKECAPEPMVLDADEEGAGISVATCDFTAVGQWWQQAMEHVRENVLVTLANIAGHLELSDCEESTCRPILEGLLHMAICPSSLAQDALTTLPPQSGDVSAKSLSLEALSKLTVTDGNVDLLIATPSSHELMQFVETTVQLLPLGTQGPLVREFAVVLLAALVASEDRMCSMLLECPLGVEYVLMMLEEYARWAKSAAAKGMQLLQLVVTGENGESASGINVLMLRKCVEILHSVAEFIGASPSRNGITLLSKYQSRIWTLIIDSRLPEPTLVGLTKIMHCLSVHETHLRAESAQQCSLEKEPEKTTENLHAVSA
ncbi:trithorax group protein osa-like [Paramacrobiotus metropolitanus]|uniref:trithorax group protein osa-like n=1 Tax=Paramacrobiotus metropolitanus TaxID=2943436 RepID=UPI0024465992|nr:trithorax group protein osa-like [Paramacrobiotus metropolitanus]XP_055356788.1 trithorax group protein osa-like [Paramacrobiotus metropolitanus]